jgi:hypothetical protein
MNGVRPRQRQQAVQIPDRQPDPALGRKRIRLSRISVSHPDDLDSPHPHNEIEMNLPHPSASDEPHPYHGA